MPLGGMEVEVASDSSFRVWEESQREGLRVKAEPGTGFWAKKEPGERSRLETGMGEEEVEKGLRQMA